LQGNALFSSKFSLSPNAFSKPFLYPVFKKFHQIFTFAGIYPSTFIRRKFRRVDEKLSNIYSKFTYRLTIIFLFLHSLPFSSRFYTLFSKSFIKLSHSQGFISALDFFRIGHSACKNRTAKARFIDYGCTTLTKTRRRFVVEFFIFIINTHCKHSAVIYNWCSEYIPPNIHAEKSMG